MRLYLDIRERAPEVYYSDSALGSYLILMGQADMCWPGSALIPTVIRQRDLRLLIDAGLVELEAEHGYRIPELDADRGQRRERASDSGSRRWLRARRDGGRAASLKTRFAVLTRGGFRCHYCGRTAQDVSLDVDHVVPRREGGTDDPANLVAACVDCNAGKSGHRLDDFES